MSSKRILPALVLAAAVALVIYFVVPHGSSTPSTSTSAGSLGSTSTIESPTPSQGGTARRYHLTFPTGWKQVPPNTVAPGQHAFAAVRQTHGRGVVVLRMQAPVTDLSAFASGLDEQL